MKPAQMAALIDHTLLKQDASEADILKLCKEAREYHFFSVCVRPNWVKLASESVGNTSVKVVSVVGFPQGTSSLQEKLSEAAACIQSGADEIDFVINRDPLHRRDLASLFRECSELVKTCGSIPVKAILETSELSSTEKVVAATIASLAGCAFVKTSTGFSTGGATRQDVALLKETVGRGARVKASGGIRSYEDALVMIEAGAARIGTSNGIGIVTHQAGAGEY